MRLNTFPLFLRLVCCLFRSWIFTLALLISGNLLSVSIPDLVRRLGSTKDWVCFLIFWVIISFPFRYVLGKKTPLFAARLSAVERHISEGDVPLRCISQGALLFVGPVPPPKLIASSPRLGNLAHLPFFDSGHFRASHFHIKPALLAGLSQGASLF